MKQETRELKQLAYDMVKLRGSTFLGEELKELWLERLDTQLKKAGADEHKN
jgi:hypothetical protein